MRLARSQRVERDQAQRSALDHVLQELALLQIAMIGEGRAQRRAQVVIAGDEMDRHRQRRQQIAQMRILLRHAGIDQVAGHQHDVRHGAQRIDVRDRARQMTCGVDASHRQDALGPDVGVGDLRDQHAVLTERPHSG
jgi:hypothetical protein